VHGDCVEAWRAERRQRAREAVRAAKARQQATSDVGTSSDISDPIGER
jgi:hypothetical protein